MQIQTAKSGQLANNAPTPPYLLYRRPFGKFFSF